MSEESIHSSALQQDNMGRNLPQMDPDGYCSINQHLKLLPLLQHKLHFAHTYISNTEEYLDICLVIPSQSFLQKLFTEAEKDYEIPPVAHKTGASAPITTQSQNQSQNYSLV